MPENDETSLEIRVILKGSHREKFEKIEKYLYDKEGISDKASILRHLIMRFEVPPPRFEHINVYYDHVTVKDNVVGKTADIYFKDDGEVYCDLCSLKECHHIDYAIELPEVQKIIKERGWKRKRL